MSSYEVPNLLLTIRLWLIGITARMGALTGTQDTGLLVAGLGISIATLKLMVATWIRFRQAGCGGRASPPAAADRPPTQRRPTAALGASSATRTTRTIRLLASLSGRERGYDSTLLTTAAAWRTC